MSMILQVLLRESSHELKLYYSAGSSKIQHAESHAKEKIKVQLEVVESQNDT
jgi:hypothetical protein